MLDQYLGRLNCRRGGERSISQLLSLNSFFYAVLKMNKEKYLFSVRDKTLSVNIQRDGIDKLACLLDICRLHWNDNPDKSCDIFRVLDSENRVYPIEEINHMEEGWYKTTALLYHCASYMCQKLLISDVGSIRYDQIETMRSKFDYKIRPGEQDSFGWLSGVIEHISSDGKIEPGFKFIFY